jgi:transposase
MRAYSLDLRHKVVEAVLRGMPKAEAARTFGIGISTVKRYVGKAHKGEDLGSEETARQKTHPRRRSDEAPRRRLEGTTGAHP